MTKAAIIAKLIDLTHRVKHCRYSDAEFGWQVIDLEKELEKLERELAEQADTFMANRYRIYNAGAKENARMRKLVGVLVIAMLGFASSGFAQASLVADKKRELGLGQNLSKEQLHSLAKAVARATGGKLIATNGENCNGFSCDKMCQGGNVVDFLRSQEDIAEPAWQIVGPITSAITCVDVPPDTGGGGGGTPSTLEAKVQALTDQVNSMRESLIVLGTRIDHLSEHGHGELPPPEGATLSDLLVVDKAILELLQKTAARFGVK